MASAYRRELMTISSKTLTVDALMGDDIVN